MHLLNSGMGRANRGEGAAILFLFVTGGMLFAGEAQFAARAEAEHRRAEARFQSNSNDLAAAWQLARACYEFNDFATNNARRAELANQGIAACRQLIARDSNSASGHYYLAIELGQLADTKRNLTAFKLVREIEREFKTADDLDEHLDYAGSARCLGLLYRDAPGWPMSIGSRRKAREWLEQAAKVAPDYPENRLNLVELYSQWKDHEAASNELKTLDALWPAARTNLTGAAWERYWDSWTTRREAVREKLDENGPATKMPQNRQN